MPRRGIAHDPFARLEILRANRDKVKPGEVLAATPMADLTGMSWSNLRNLFDTTPEFETSGDVVRGAQGVEWRINAPKTLDRLIRLYEGQAADRARLSELTESQNNIQLVGTTSRTLKELIEAITLRTKVAVAERDDGNLVERQEGLDVVHALYAGFASGYGDALNEHDPNGGLSPEVRMHIEAYARILQRRHYETSVAIIGKLENDRRSRGDRAEG